MSQSSRTAVPAGAAVLATGCTGWPAAASGTSVSVRRVRPQVRALRMGDRSGGGVWDRYTTPLGSGERGDMVPFRPKTGAIITVRRFPPMAEPGGVPEIG